MQADDSISDGISWYAEATVPTPGRPRLTFDLDVDVCVIGGGLAGLTAAREIALRGWSVAVLEAQTVGFGASGHNLGFVLPGFQQEIDRIVERVGIDHAKELWSLSERGQDYVRETIRETNMPGVKPVHGWLWVSKFRDDPGLAARATLLREKFGAQVETWSTGQVRDVLKSQLYRNGIHFPRAFQIHPLNYLFGLAAAAEAAGVRIFEHTPALSLDPAGVRKRIGTPSARVRSPQIVLAGNTSLGALMPRLAASLLPVTSFVAVTERIGDRLAEAITFKGGVSDSNSVDNHYRIIDGDRLMWSGGLRMWEADPKRFVRRLAGDIRRAYPQLGRVSVEHVWSGTAGRAVHDMPQIGEVARGVWVANAFSGQGFNTTAMAGELIARGIVESDQTWRLFSPYDLMWAGGKWGRCAMQAVHWSRRFRERLDALINYSGDTAEEEAILPVEAATSPAGDAVPVALAIEVPVLESPIVPVPGPDAAEASAASAPVAGKATITIVPKSSKKPAPRKPATPGKRAAKAVADGDAAPRKKPAARRKAASKPKTTAEDNTDSTNGAEAEPPAVPAKLPPTADGLM
jgi:gamma-glutamylputrescine oxidase